MSETHDRATLLKSWALEAGFERAGVAVLAPSADGEHLRAWLARGEHAGMEWIARRVAEREDPRRLLAGARSALVVALQYAPLDGASEPAGDLWPRVARYARGRDYHDVMSGRLRRLGARIEAAFPGSRTRTYVDTGPILERELAARAGLGVIGKNTNLLDRNWGSYFLLGELLTTLDLAPDPPVADLCGRCTNCLDACPTGALVEPFRLDANRCISYWTIEHRGAVPEAMREGLGDWVFGCDICQEVCPYNQKNRGGTDDALRLPAARAEIDLAGLLGIGRERYVETFRGSPMKRAKQSGLKRNAAVAMGNRGDARYVPALEGALGDETPVVRGHAAWALGRIGDGAAAGALAAAAEVETDAGVRAEIARARQRIAGHERAVSVRRES